jgi:hypothetical protein
MSQKLAMMMQGYGKEMMVMTWVAGAPESHGARHHHRVLLWVAISRLCRLFRGVDLPRFRRHLG